MRRLTRIAWVIPTMRVGGTEKQLLLLMRGLAQEFELTLICTRSEGALIGDARRVGAYVRVLDGHGGWDFRQGWRLRRIFRAHTPDVLHSYLFGFDLHANRAARRVGVPVVISSRREMATWQRRRHIAMQRRANALVDRVVANSRAVAERAIRAEGLDPARVVVIPNGVDADALQSRTAGAAVRARFKLPQDQKIVTLVANLSPVKDHRLFLDMANLILKRRNDVHFLMVGTGDLVPDVMGLVARRGQLGNFTRIATVNELPDLYAISELCMLTSQVEGFPNAIVEAMAAGKPVVAPAVGGIPELVREGATGRLIASRRPEDFAAAVEHLLDHPEEGAAMGAAGAAWVREHLTVPRLVEAHRSLYLDLLARAGRGDG
jgi:glycosyltransferase involved in cell wall biosynthesis